MIKYFIQGYGDKTVAQKANFAPVKDSSSHIVLFISYSDYDISLGKKIEYIVRDEKIASVDLTIEKIYLGFGELSDSIPKGYKSIVLVHGEPANIKKIKKILPKVSNWNQSAKDSLGIDHTSPVTKKRGKAVLYSFVIDEPSKESGSSIKISAKSGEHSYQIRLDQNDIFTVSENDRPKFEKDITQIIQE